MRDFALFLRDCCEQFAILIAAAILALLLVLSCTPPACPAPSPSARVRPALCAADVCGRWRLEWGESRWEATFSPDGHYASWGNNVTWIGSWRLDGGVLTVTERILDSSSSFNTGYTWKAKLSRHRPGALKGVVLAPGPGVTFGLTPAAGAASR